MMIFVAGCGNLNRTPRYDVPEPMQIETFKRRTAHDSVDYFFTAKRDAYSRVTSPMKGRSDSERNVLERHGQPDYIRKDFKSVNGETVDEWVYWDRSIVVQFVQRELVYEGELTDMDRIRVRYGYPRRAWAQDYYTGVRRDLWDYQGMILDTGGTIFTFSDEKLVSQNEY